MMVKIKVILKLLLTKIFKLVDSMPMSKNNNLSLYADIIKKLLLKD